MGKFFYVKHPNAMPCEEIPVQTQFCRVTFSRTKSPKSVKTTKTVRILPLKNFCHQNSQTAVETNNSSKPLGTSLK